MNITSRARTVLLTAESYQILSGREQQGKSGLGGCCSSYTTSKFLHQCAFLVPGQLVAEDRKVDLLEMLTAQQHRVSEEKPVGVQLRDNYRVILPECAASSTQVSHAPKNPRPPNRRTRSPRLLVVQGLGVIEISQAAPGGCGDWPDPADDTLGRKPASASAVLGFGLLFFFVLAALELPAFGPGLN